MLGDGASVLPMWRSLVFEAVCGFAGHAYARAGGEVWRSYYNQQRGQHPTLAHIGPQSPTITHTIYSGIWGPNKARKYKGLLAIKIIVDI